MQIEYGGQYEADNETGPQIAGALVMSVMIIFFVLLWHFKKVSEALLIMVCLTLCVFGMVVGLLIQNVEFSMTSVLGFVSLMGILVRNGVILFDYAAEVKELEKLSLKDAIHVAAERRMRPIYLPDISCSLYGCGSYDPWRQRTLGAYGCRYLLWYADYDVLHPDRDACRLLESDGKERRIEKEPHPRPLSKGARGVK